MLLNPIRSRSRSSQPKLMVTAYALERSYLAAGEKAALTVTVRNTSSGQQVKNIKLSFSEESGEIWPEGTGAPTAPGLAQAAPIPGDLP
jgi:hypothetical protein